MSQVIPLRPAEARVDDLLNALARQVGDRPIEVRRRGRFWHASTTDGSGRRCWAEGAEPHTALLRLSRALSERSVPVSGDPGGGAA